MKSSISFLVAMSLLAIACGGESDSGSPQDPQQWVCIAGKDGCQCHLGSLGAGETALDPSSCVAPSGGCCRSDAATKTCVCGIDSWCAATAVVEATCAIAPAIMGCDSPGQEDTFGIGKCPDQNLNNGCTCTCKCKEGGIYECVHGWTCM